MSTWRSAELESLLGGPLDSVGITEESLSRLVQERVLEFDQLDFKARFYVPSTRPRSDWSGEQEFAKDIGGFANQRGGLLLIGIEETAGAASRLAPVSGLAPEAEERRLRQALLNFQAPIADCWFVWVDAADGGHYVAIVVPPSNRSPHAVLGDPGDGRRPLRYPVRHGADTNWLTESEVAERYRRRQNAQQDEERRVHAVVETGGRRLSRANGVWMFVAAIPSVGAEGSLDQMIVDSIDDWLHQNQPQSPSRQDLPVYGRPIPAPGCVTFTGSLRTASEDESAIRDAYLELHLDGSVFGATPIAARTTGEEDSRSVGEFTLLDDTALICDVALRWCAHQIGSWGMATLLVGLIEPNQAEGEIVEPVVFVTRDTGRLRRGSRTREVTGRPLAETVADLTAVDTDQQRLSVTYRLLAGLLQWFGMAEPAQLRPSGALVARQFGMGSYRQIIEWAVRHGVEVERLPGD